jgi:hypothetical protein
MADYTAKDVALITATLLSNGCQWGPAEGKSPGQIATDTALYLIECAQDAINEANEEIRKQEAERLDAQIAAFSMYGKYEGGKLVRDALAMLRREIKGDK